MQQIRNYINGALVAPESGEYLDNVNPAIGKVYSLIPDSDKRDVDAATAAAKATFPAWSRTPKNDRARILLRTGSKTNLVVDNYVYCAMGEIAS